MGKKDKDKEIKKSKKAAKAEVKKGKDEVATTATDKPKSKKDKAIAKQKAEKKQREERIAANNAAMDKISPARTKPELRTAGVNTSNLPEHVTKHRIECRSTISPEILYVDLADVTGTSTTMYVNDIHAAVPTILEQVYWVNTQAERWPLGRVSKEDYEFVLKWSKGRLPEERHGVAVVDCAVNPTLSYSWRMPELKGQPFPTLDLILKADEDFKDNPTYIHNRNPKFVVRENQPTQGDSLPPAEEEEDFIMDDEEDNIEESADGEEEFEFTD